MISLKLILMILALVCFLLAALGVAWTRGNLIGAGLFLYTLAMMIV
jgi:hypothetical protein